MDNSAPQVIPDFLNISEIHNTVLGDLSKAVKNLEAMCDCIDYSTRLNDTKIRDVCVVTKNSPYIAEEYRNKCLFVDVVRLYSVVCGLGKVDKKLSELYYEKFAPIQNKSGIIRFVNFDADALYNEYMKSKNEDN